MKKHNIFIFLTCISMTTAMFADEEEQPGYWQRFKNWLSGASAQAQNMATIPYEWAKNSIAKLKPQEKIALAAALGGFTGGVTGHAYQTKSDQLLTRPGIHQGMISGIYALLGVMLAEPLINKYVASEKLNHTIALLRQDLNDIQKFPNTQSKIDTLKAMQAAYGATGDKPNKVALDAVTTILSELENK